MNRAEIPLSHAARIRDGVGLDECAVKVRIERGGVLRIGFRAIQHRPSYAIFGLGSNGEMRRIVWLGDSLDRLRDFPSPIQGKLGFALYEAQVGEKNESAKPLRGFGEPVWQVRADDVSGTYRAVYVVHIRDAIYVLHTFSEEVGFRHRHSPAGRESDSAEIEASP